MNYKNYLIRKNIKNALENVLQFSFMVIAIVPYKIYQALNKKNKQEKAEEKRAKKKVEGIYSDLRFYTRNKENGSVGIINFHATDLAEAEMKMNLDDLGRQFDRVVEILQKDKYVTVELLDFSKCKYAISYGSSAKAKIGYKISVK